MLFYQGFQDEFTFRDSKALRIPQSILKGAFQLSIDIIVRGISGQYYQNPVTYPTSTFYGTCLLVFEDCLSQKIDIYQPRTRIYEGRVSEAFEQWNRFRTFDPIYEYFVQLLIKSGEDPSEIPKYWYLDPEFVMLPIREFTFQPVGHIQWDVEISWIEPKPFTTPDGVLHNGKNGGNNPTKGNGMPSNGMQPTKSRNPDFPFEGLPSASSGSEIESRGYDTNNSNGVENLTDPANARDYSGEIYWLEVIARAKSPDFPNGCASKRIQTIYVQLLDSSITYSTNAVDKGLDGCGGRRVQIDVILSGGDGTPITSPNTSNGDVSISRQSGKTLPANSLIYVDA